MSTMIAVLVIASVIICLTIAYAAFDFIKSKRREQWIVSRSRPGTDHELHDL